MAANALTLAVWGISARLATARYWNTAIGLTGIRDHVRPERAGHAAAGGANPPDVDVDFIHRETATLLDQVTDGGKRLD